MKREICSSIPFSCYFLSVSLFFFITTPVSSISVKYIATIHQMNNNQASGPPFFVIKVTKRPIKIVKIKKNPNISTNKYNTL